MSEVTVAQVSAGAPPALTEVRFEISSVITAEQTALLLYAIVIKKDSIDKLLQVAASGEEWLEITSELSVTQGHLMIKRRPDASDKYLYIMSGSKNQVAAFAAITAGIFTRHHKATFGFLGPVEAGSIAACLWSMS